MNVIRRWPYFVPLLFFVVICLIQPSDRWVPPIGPLENYPLPAGFTRLVYDDADVAAYMLRAENAARGRTAGKTKTRYLEIAASPTTRPIAVAFSPSQFGMEIAWHDMHWQTFRSGIAPGELVKINDKQLMPAYAVKNEPLVAVPSSAVQTSIEPIYYSPEKFAQLVDANPPLEKHYFLEYPPAALYLFRLSQIGSGRPEQPVSGAILDANQVSTTFYAPRGDVEKQLWRSWRYSQRVHAFLMLAALVGLMVLVAHGVGRNGTASGPIWLFILPGFLYFTPCRYDILPAAFVVAAIALTDRKRPLLGALVLGLAVALKTYPLVLAPLILRYAAGSWKAAILWCIVFVAPVAAFAASLALTDGVDAVIEPLKFQMNRPAELWLVLYGKVLPTALASNEPESKLLRSGVVLLCVLAMAWKRPPDVESLLRRCAIAVIIFMGMQVFYSPQWWMWLAVLLIPLVRTHRWLLALVVVSDLLTHALFPWFYDMHLNDLLDASGVGVDPKRNVNIIAALFVFTRAGLWFCILVVLAANEMAALRKSRASKEKLDEPRASAREVVILSNDT